MKPADGVARAANWRETGLTIARGLADEAIWHGELCAFCGATPPESLQHRPRYRSMRGDLYEGSAGIARFLGVAAALSGETKLRDTALGALRHAWRTSEGWSLFMGGMGTGLVTLELAELLNAPELVPVGVQQIERASRAALDAALDNSGPYDLLVGTAGVIVGLRDARPYDTDQAWLARALALGESVLAAGVPEGLDGLSWPLAPGSPMRLCGLAHGASGIALAFESLADAEEIYRTAAQRARAFERIHYSAQAGSWADLRSADIGHPHMWCHGSIGIAAERLGAHEHDVLARADAVGGLAGARSHTERLLAGPTGPGGSDSLNGSLCHGLAGVIDLFLDAWLATRDSGWMAIAGEVGDLLCNDAQRGTWRSGVPGGWPAPGLMLGRAGTGWALLRLAAPERVRSGWRVTLPHKIA